MASNEPAAGGTPDSSGPQEYAQPQDPWEGGFEYPPGQSSMPTDPIPHQYDPYSGTYPPYNTGGTWVQQSGTAGTVPPVGWAPQPPPPKPNKAIPILVALAVVLVLGGGGAAAYYIATRDNTRTTGTGGPTTTPTTGAPATSAAPPTSAAPTDGTFDPYAVEEGDCVANSGTNEKPRMAVVDCVPGVYKVIKVRLGAEVKQDTDEVLSDDEARATCKGTGFTFFYKNNFDGTDNDVVFCMNKVS
ncbi:hypothetical protein [Luedemannella helvata]|uniref:Flagellar basal body protein FliL n=1 Tax=Luedemannella helvata TaxID=349315 RepID=A0ABN2L031_9ACTN